MEKPCRLDRRGGATTVNRKITSRWFEGGGHHKKCPVAQAATDAIQCARFKSKFAHLPPTLTSSRQPVIQASGFAFECPAIGVPVQHKTRDRAAGLAAEELEAENRAVPRRPVDLHSVRRLLTNLLNAGATRQKGQAIRENTRPFSHPARGNGCRI
jgi:hypothetical protein